MANSASYTAISVHPAHQPVVRASRATLQEEDNNFKAKIQSTKNCALAVAILQTASRFFGTCALTWASIILLGAFAASLRNLDFYLISILLLSEAFRLYFSKLLSKLLTRPLFLEHRRPQDFEFTDLQTVRSFRLDLVGQLSTNLYAVLSLASAILRLRFSKSRQYSFTIAADETPTRNVSKALYIFYDLVVLNSCTAILSSIMRTCARSRCTQDSLVSYHDEVQKVAMTSGLPDANEINTVQFAFEKLAIDFARNIRPLVIQSRSSDLIKHIYASEDGVGITCEHMRSTNVRKQVAAAALPGFWAEEEKIEKQVALFWALQDRLYGAGKVAEAAANSICSLSKTWADSTRLHPFLLINSNRCRHQNVVDSVIDVVLHPIQPSLLFQLRALEGCCRSRQVLEDIYGDGNQRSGDETRARKLCSKLKSVLESAGNINRATTKMYAASALHALWSFRGELEVTYLQEMVYRIDFSEYNREREGRPPYLWRHEQEMLDKVRLSLRLPAVDWHDIHVVRAGEEHSSTCGQVACGSHCIALGCGCWRA